MLNITPSVKSVSVPKANNSDSEQSALKPKDMRNKRTKKRRRETGDSAGDSLQNSLSVARKDKKKAKTMEDKDITSVNCTQESGNMILSVEMQQMERRITENITNHNQ